MEQLTYNNTEAMLAGLNPAQRDAALNTEGPMLVIAGAGSGKTRVLTTRIALLLDKGVPPERILALTFTKKAAEEMRNRIIAMQGDAARRICMGTFHSVFIRFLRPFAGRIAFPENFTILDEDDSMAALKRVIGEVIAPTRPPKEEWTKEMTDLFKEQDKAYKTKSIHCIISACKNDLVTADAYCADPQRAAADQTMGRPLTGEIFRRYRDACHRSAVMDFDDILLYTDILLASNPDVLGMISSAYDYILVDEYQDTNLAQNSILRRLTWWNKNICVVGDDSQSIYAFRGARIQNIINFVKDYPGCRTVKLETNYRSSRNIVNAANNLIEYNDTRIPKVCVSQGEKGEPISIRELQNEKGEAQFIAETIAQGVAEGHRYADYAVLFRTNAQSRAVEDALVKGRIPYTVYSGVSFFQRMEVKDMLAYFKLAVNPYDDESFLRVVNKPVRGFGAAAQKRLCEIARAWGMSLWETAMNPSIDLCGFAPRALAALKGFTNEIGGYTKTAATQDAWRAATLITDGVGIYADYAKDAGDEESRKRADNIRELVDSVKSYEEDTLSANEGLLEDRRERPTLTGYLQNAMLLSNADTGESGADKVSVMTVHCAKGLEYDTVFVAGMDEKLFPLEIDCTEFEREEERRLFYVAMTRAKRKLYLTRAETRMRFGKRERQRPSVFLTELRNKKKEEA